MPSYRKRLKNIVKKIKEDLFHSHKRLRPKNTRKLLLKQNKQILELLTLIYGDTEKDAPNATVPTTSKIS